jgi:hypothetical protein
MFEINGYKANDKIRNTKKNILYSNFQYKNNHLLFLFFVIFLFVYNFSFLVFYCIPLHPKLLGHFTSSIFCLFPDRITKPAKT